MTRKLHDYALSTSCYKVRLLLGFLKLEHDTQAVDFYPGLEQRSAAFKRLNPLGQIPVMEDNGQVLCDAHAILCHLANHYDTTGQWLPRDKDHFGPVMMWLMFAGCEMTGLSDARMHDVFGFELDIQARRRQAHHSLRILEDALTQRQLQGRQWLVSDQPTIADIACFPDAALAGDGGVGHEDYPALRNWLRDFRRLPGFQEMPGIPELV